MTEQVPGSPPSVLGGCSSPPSVLVGLPNLCWHHTEQVIALIQMLQSPLAQLDFDFLSTMPYEAAVNQIILDFLKDSYDYLLLMDVDNPPSKNPLELLRYKKDIIVLPTPVQKTDTPEWNVYPPRDKGDPELRRISHGGSGCMLIARRVLKKIVFPFRIEWTRDGLVDRSGDYTFCRRSIELGFEVFSAENYKCRHFKDFDLARIVRDP